MTNEMERTYLNWIIHTDVIDVMDMVHGLKDRPTYDADDPFTIKERDTPIPAIVCKDGEYVSVQTGEYLYCSPRRNFSGWIEVEAGFPSVMPPESWEKYSEDEWDVPFKKRLQSSLRDISWSANASYKYGEDGHPYVRWLKGAVRGFKRGWRRITRPQACDTVYPYIPVRLIEEFIEVHGGEDTEKCFENLRERNK